MTLKAKDIPALFYPWHSLSEVQDELQKDFIWQITKQQDSGSPQVVQTESLRSQFKTSTLNKEGVKLEGIILSCTMPTMGFGSALYLASCGGVLNGRTPCAFAKKSESYFTQGSALINTSKTPYCISIRLKRAWASATLHGPKQMITS